MRTTYSSASRRYTSWGGTRLTCWATERRSSPGRRTALPSTLSRGAAASADTGALDQGKGVWLCVMLALALAMLRDLEKSHPRRMCNIFIRLARMSHAPSRRGKSIWRRSARVMTHGWHHCCVKHARRVALRAGTIGTNIEVAGRWRWHAFYIMSASPPPRARLIRHRESRGGGAEAVGT